jgi:hypothetical protein
MPHYADGTPAKHGDLVLRRDSYQHGTDLVGIVMSIQPGSDSCNAQVIPLAARQKGSELWLPVTLQNTWCCTLSECSKLGDEQPVNFDTTEHVKAAMASG